MLVEQAHDNCYGGQINISSQYVSLETPKFKCISELEQKKISFDVNRNIIFQYVFRCGRGVGSIVKGSKSLRFSDLT